MHTYLYIYIHIYTYICIHTYTHIYIYMYLNIIYIYTYIYVLYLSTTLQHIYICIHVKIHSVYIHMSWCYQFWCIPAINAELNHRPQKVHFSTNFCRLDEAGSFFLAIQLALAARRTIGGISSKTRLAGRKVAKLKTVSEICSCENQCGTCQFLDVN